MPRAQREQSILDAAEEEFGRAGFQSASMERIAAAGGITKALVYQYFGSKEGLYCACVERGRAQLFADLQAAAGSARGNMLAAIVERYFAHLESGSWYVLYGDAPRRAVDDMRRRNAEVIAELVRSGTALEGLDVELVAQLIVGAGEQVGRWWLEHPELPAQLVRARFAVALAGALTGLGTTTPAG